MVKIKIDKAKAKKFLKKAFKGAKKGAKETSAFIGHYGPKVHRYTGGVAKGITGTFAVKPGRSQVEIDLSLKKPMIMKKKKVPHRMAMKKMMGTNRVKMTRMRKRVDWNNLGIKY